MRHRMDDEIVGRTATDERLVEYDGDDLDPIRHCRAGATHCLDGYVSIAEVANESAMVEGEEVDVLASAGIKDVNEVCLAFNDAFDQLAIARVDHTEWSTEIIGARLYHRCAVCGEGGRNNEAQQGAKNAA